MSEVVNYQAEMGRHAGRATALTVILPLKVGSTLILGPYLWLLRRVASRHWAVGHLDRQRFVLAIRWSILPPFAKGGLLPWNRSSDTRWQMLFESNFDGDWDEYLDVFGAVLALPLKTIIFWGRGFPGFDDINLFKAYSRAHDVEPDYYGSAYPELTSGVIYQEILAQEGRALAEASRRSGGYGRSHPGWTTLLLPLKQGTSSKVHVAARLFAPHPDPEDPAEPIPGDASRLPKDPFLETDLVHFVRIAVLDQPSGSWLLITFTHDGSTREVIEHAVACERAAIEDPDRNGVDQALIWNLVRHTVGAPDDRGGWWDDARLVDHLIESIPPTSWRWMAYCGYPDRSVGEISGFIEDQQRLNHWPEPEIP